jgi:hypothetical protein
MMGILLGAASALFFYPGINPIGLWRYSGKTGLERCRKKEIPPPVARRGNGSPQTMPETD